MKSIVHDSVTTIDYRLHAQPLEMIICHFSIMEKMIPNHWHSQHYVCCNIKVNSQEVILTFFKDEKNIGYKQNSSVSIYSGRYVVLGNRNKTRSIQCAYVTHRVAAMSLCVCTYAHELLYLCVNPKITTTFTHPNYRNC